MNDKNVINIEFTGIVDYLRDKDLEIMDLRSRIRDLESKEKILRNQLQQLSHTLNKAIDFIREFDSYIPEDDVDDLLLILKGEK